MEGEERNMARYHRQTETTTYDLAVPTGAGSLGRLLGEAGTDWKRIGLDLLVRAAIVVLATVIFWRRGDLSDSSPAVLAVVAIIYAAVVLFPLRHCRDSLQFYENGIVYRGKTYLFRTPKAEWSRVSGTGHFLAVTYLYLDGMPNSINVSCVRNARETFTRLYVSGAERCGA